jgi:hypothetical protein
MARGAANIFHLAAGHNPRKVPFSCDRRPISTANPCRHLKQGVAAPIQLTKEAHWPVLPIRAPGRKPDGSGTKSFQQEQFQWHLSSTPT